MTDLKISPNFTVDDIHKVREHNYELTKAMSESNRSEYYEKKARALLSEVGIIPKNEKDNQHIA